MSNRRRRRDALPRRGDRVVLVCQTGDEHPGVVLARTRKVCEEHGEPVYRVRIYGWGSELRVEEVCGASLAWSH